MFKQIFSPVLKTNETDIYQVESTLFDISLLDPLCSKPYAGFGICRVLCRASACLHNAYLLNVA